jgi:hypothetical protein
VAQANEEVPEEQEVLADITSIPQGIPIREHTTNQVHPLLESIRGMGKMSYKGK